MADDISFTISAEDQASKVVDTVKNKINNFGTDIAKMALGIAGPMALVSLALGFIMKKVDEYKQSKIDAKNEAAKAEEAIENAATEKEKDKIKERLEAYKKAEAEKTAFLKQQEENRKKKISLYEEIKTLKADLQNGGPLTGGDLLASLSQNVMDASREFKTKQRNYNQGRTGANYASDVDVLEAEKKYLEAQKAYRDENNKQTQQNATDKKEGKVSKPEEVKAVKDTVKVTVSSLREIGGSFGGGDINTGIEAQITLAQKQIDILGVIADNTKPDEPAGTPIEMQDTNFTLPGGGTISAAELLGF